MIADLAIRDARIVDGSGAAAKEGHVMVRGGRIVAVDGTSLPARREIDAGGLVLTPGFVDVHTHDDGALLRYPGMEFKIAQGCTTVVLGNCGFSAAPSRPDASAHPTATALFGLKPVWRDLNEYVIAVEAAWPAVNAVTLVGHNTLGTFVTRSENRAPTPADLRAMRSSIRQAMEQGACGLSTGLIYEPGRYSTTEELVELAREVAIYGGVYATHVRNERDFLLEAIDEALTIGREAGVRVQISHHKAALRRNWGKVADSLARIDRARSEGVDVALDVYPYTASSSPIASFFGLGPIDLGNAEVTRVAYCPPFPELEGRMLVEIAAERGASLEAVIGAILDAPGGERALCVVFAMDEHDVEENLRHPFAMIGSDGIPDLDGKPHPRLFGTFPRVLAEYVRSRGLLSLEEAVRRMTSLPCERFGLVERGLVREGYYADLVLFDPRAVADMATYDDPQREPIGISHVVVNGRIAYEGGRHTGIRSGRMLRFRRPSVSELDA